jgi:RNA polymerase sigma factor (sigma-70 family)
VSTFPTTRWTLVAQAQRGSREALSELLDRYWLPLYVFARATGLTREAAEDAVQDFAAHAIERGVFAKADSARGKLRTFLKTALRHHLSDQRDKRTAQKRGGRARHEDLEDAERFLQSAAGDPERLFDQQWAELVMRRALEELERAFTTQALHGDFALVKRYFDGELDGDYERVAKAHHLSVPALKSLLHRARGRYRDLLRAIVKDTVDDQTEPDHELDELVRALGSRS